MPRREQWPDRCPPSLGRKLSQTGSISLFLIRLMEGRTRAREAPAVSARARSFLILRFGFAAHSSCKGFKWGKRDREIKTLRLTIVPQPRTARPERFL